MIIAGATRAQSQADADPWETIDSLRAAGDFARALVVAYQVLTDCDADPETPAWELGDARREVATIKLILDMPAAEQAALAEAGRAELELHENWGSKRYPAAAAAARRLLELSRRHLAGC